MTRECGHLNSVREYRSVLVCVKIGNICRNKMLRINYHSRRIKFRAVDKASFGPSLNINEFQVCLKTQLLQHPKFPAMECATNPILALKSNVIH